MRVITYLLAALMATLPLSACAYDGKKPLPEQDQLPQHLQTGKQIRIENSHYLILDQVQAYDTGLEQNRRAVQSSNAEIGRKGSYSIQAQPLSNAEGRPVVWNQTSKRYSILLDELGLVLTDNSAAQRIADRYGLNLTVQIERLNRAYYQVDANKIPDLMRQLQQDTQVKQVLPSLLDRVRQPQ